ncbi:enoyl-CoA hydratase/isomerase family protein [Ralstonia soli]|uniref:Enoyl-CoA hydratase/isomerase family protein n=1 Tax=Ralstonia soli TaxID=2953896 RepID=A0ABT1AEA2_9RALS|nr:enoyl-CoA hydratase/isomerase family protein [Ralstonia soli]MCO5396701.1 enoyl-CoA hydratase/isomerase family protein [Ralstonia soli]
MSLNVTIQGFVASVAINRPEKLNALDLAAFAEIGRLAEELDRDERVRVVVFRGTGHQAFSAGADISELVDITNDEARDRAKCRQAALQKLEDMSKPTVAVMSGYALGGGVELALACTFRIATADVKIAFPEVKIGQLPGAGGTQRLPRLIGRSRALDMMLTGRMIGAEEALGFGLLNRVIDDPNCDADAFIGQFTSLSPVALAAIKRAVHWSEGPLMKGLEMEVDQLYELNKSLDAEEGKRAFLQKRPPVFVGR